MDADVVSTARTLLFVPGDRPDRFGKAAASGADLVILDLEDAVAPDAKQAARSHVRRWLAEGHRCAVRINAVPTPWADADLAELSDLAPILMVPKAEDPAELATIAAQLGKEAQIVALVETAAGVLRTTEIAQTPGVRRLAFGSFDLASQLGVDPLFRPALAAARAALVLASAAAGIAPPVDGVTASVTDEALLLDESRHARKLGFGGRLCIHPRQVSVVAGAFLPTDDEIRWARSILDAVAEGDTANRGVVIANGNMVDKPVVERARRVLADVDGPAGRS